EVAFDFTEVADFVAEFHDYCKSQYLYRNLRYTSTEINSKAFAEAYSIDKGAAMSTERVKVTVGVCGGVAAYKAVELVRLLQDAGLDPHVVMTRAAEEFVRPLTFAAISGHKVITRLWGEDAGAVAEGDESSIEHIH